MNFKRWVIIVLLITIILVVVFALNQKSEIVFTDNELEWMNNHPVIYVGPDPTFGPIEFFDEKGNYKGAAADYIEWIESHTPLHFEVIRFDNWSDILDAIENKEIDMLGAATKTDQREEYLTFTKPYFSIPNVVLTRLDYEGKVNFNNLSGEKVVVINDYAIEDYLASNFPGIEMIPVDSVEEGLALVSLGTYNYMAVSLAQTSYYLPESGMTNLKVSGDVELDYELSFAIRDDYSVLKDILDKALIVMPKDYKNTVYDKWINFEFDRGISKEVLYGLIIVLVIIFVIVIIVLFFNRVLKLSVNQKTEALNLELEERLKIEKNLAELNENLEEEVHKRTAELREAFEDLKKIQDELIESEKMASLSRILVNISHNLNTPIGSSITLISFDEMMIEKIESSVVDAPTKEHLSVLKNSIQMISKELMKAKTFIDQIKNLSSIEYGTKKSVHIKSYLTFLVESYKKVFHEKNIEIEIRCSETLEMVISTIALDNIFRNLINNSIDYGFEKRTSGHIIIEINCNNTECEFVYKDNGNGIDEAISKNIFDPLVTSNMAKTNGWGLNILYNTVKFELDGQVKFNSEINQGVEFTIALKHL